MTRDPMKNSLGKGGLDVLENHFLCPDSLIHQVIWFPSKLSLGEDSGWCESIVFIIYYSVTSYPKTQGLKNSYSELLTIVCVKNSAGMSRVALPQAALAGISCSEAWSQWSTWARSSRRLQTYIWHFTASWWPRGCLSFLGVC